MPRGNRTRQQIDQPRDVRGRPGRASSDATTHEWPVLVRRPFSSPARASRPARHRDLAAEQPRPEAALLLWRRLRALLGGAPRHARRSASRRWRRQRRCPRRAAAPASRRAAEDRRRASSTMPRVGCWSQNVGRLGAAREVFGVDHRPAFEPAVSCRRPRRPRSRRSPACRTGGRRSRVVDPGRRRRSHSGLSSCVAAFMNFAHTGTATSAAKPLGRIVRGWSKPTQTPATSFGVKPTNQASLKSLVVPVLPAAGSVKPERARARLPVPALITSASIVDIRNAVDVADRADAVSCRLVQHTGRPDPRRGGSAAAAAPRRGWRTPRRPRSSTGASLRRSRARATARSARRRRPSSSRTAPCLGMPTCCSRRTAARLLDVRSAGAQAHRSASRVLVFRRPGALRAWRSDRRGDR